MPKALVAFLLVAVAVAASHEHGLPPLEWDTVTRLPAEETEFSEVYMQRKNSNRQTLHNLQTLKAYCLAAYDKAEDMKSSHASMSKATLVGLILKYGKASKKGVGNIVSDYATVTGGLKAYFNRGIGKYILEHLDNAIIHGDGAVKVKKNVIGKYVAGFDGRALGFKSSPHYFRTLSVNLSEYQAKKVRVDASSKGADAEAAAAWLMKGAHKKYKSFLARIKAQVKAKSERLWKKVIANAFKKEKQAWKKNKSLKPQVPGGVEGARAEFQRLGKAMKLPSNKEMKAAASRLAAKWRAANKSVAKSAGKVIKKLEGKKKKKEKVKIAAKAKAKKVAKVKKAEAKAKKLEDKKAKAKAYASAAGFMLIKIKKP